MTLAGFVRRLTALCFLGAIGLVLVGCDGAPRITQWPTEGWTESSPEAQGMDSGDLAGMVETVRRESLAVDSVLVVRHGQVVLDVHFYPYDGKRLHDVASVTKSVTTLLLGIALDQGLVKGLDTPAVDTFPGLGERRPELRAITLGDLASMRSGLRCGLSPGEPELYAMLAQPDWLASVLALPVAGPPGEGFAYCSGNMHWLAAILAHASGGDLAGFARRRLFTPLGIERIDWPTDPQGIPRGWGDLRLQPRDMAKIGLLMLHQGQWDGRQIVSADWVRRATRQQVAANGEGYGYGWWIPGPDYPGVFEARGRGGQTITVWPARDLVVVLTGAGYRREALLPHLLASIRSDAALPENPEAARRLTSAIEAVRQPPVLIPPPAMPDTANRVSDRRFVLDANPLGVEAVRLSFDGGPVARLSLTRGGKTFDLPLGLDGRQRLAGEGPEDQAVALRGRWTAPQVFELEYDEVAGINRFVLRFEFMMPVLSLEVIDPFGPFGGSIRGMAVP